MKRLPMIAVSMAMMMAGALSAVPADAAPASGAPASPNGGMFDALDTDRDGRLSREEFQKGYASLQRGFEAERRLREQFRKLDADASGALEAAEYGQLVLVRQAGAKAPPHAAFDADDSGGLDFAEYLAAVGTLARGPTAAER